MNVKVVSCWDGGHKRERFLTDVLAPFVEWVPVCPEVEAGFGTPRESMRLVERDGRLRLVTNKTTVDTLHWSIFNIPGSAKGIAEGLAAGDLADGSRNGPGIGGRGGGNMDRRLSNRGSAKY